MNPDIARFAHGEIFGPICIGRIRSGLTRNIGADSNLVWLSFDTLRKQLAHHPELALDFYEDLDWLLHDGEAIADRRDRCLNIVRTLHDVGGRQRWYKATIKSIRSNGRIMLLSVHKIGPADYKRLVRNSKK